MQTLRAIFNYLIVFGLFGFAAIWAPQVSAQAQTPSVVMDSTNFDFYSSYNFNDVEWRGPAFTTGPLPTKITEITLGITPVASGFQARLELFQLDDSTQRPTGAALAGADIPVVYSADGANLSANTYQASRLGSIPNITLQSNKKYALILSGPVGSAFGLSDNDSPGNAYTYSGGFTVAAEGYLQTNDSGATWVANSFVTPALRLTVQPVILAPSAPTPVPAIGVAGLVSLVSIMALLGLRRSRKQMINK